METWSRKSAGIVLLALCPLLVISSQTVSAKGKTLSVEDRQVQLMQQINAAQRGKQLTDKEARKLRSDLADVARDKTAMLAKGSGTLSAENTNKLESELNDVSQKLLKLQLDKRVSDRSEKKSDDGKKAKSESKEIAGDSKAQKPEPKGVKTGSPSAKTESKSSQSGSKQSK
ncbi:MAG TPA: hypothetical protein V6C72_13045 [Chroococcales cyanobacterium]